MWAPGLVPVVEAYPHTLSFRNVDYTIRYTSVFGTGCHAVQWKICSTDDWMKIFP